jgi:hypothetical protein
LKSVDQSAEAVGAGVEASATCCTCLSKAEEETSLVEGGTGRVSTAALEVVGGTVGVLRIMGVAVETDAAASANVERSALKDDVAEFDTGGVSNRDSAATRATVPPPQRRSSIEAIATLVRMLTCMK